ERERGKLGMNSLRDAPRVAGPVEEIGVAEGDMRGARLDLLADIREHDIERHREEPTFIDRCDRAVATAGQASPCGLDIPGWPGEPSALDPNIGVERLEPAARRRREGEPLDDGRLSLIRAAHPADIRVLAPIEPLDQRYQRLLVLAADHGVGPV